MRQEQGKYHLEHCVHMSDAHSARGPPPELMTLSLIVPAFQGHPETTGVKTTETVKYHEPHLGNTNFLFSAQS